VLCTARLEKQKDISTLIRAMGQVENAKLTILGDGSERSELERLGRGLNIDVEFVGNVSRSEAIVRLKGADIFVLPSRFEGLGIAAVEAMAMGVPTIVANFPASSEYIVSEQTGLTFPIGDVDALAGRNTCEDEVGLVCPGAKQQYSRRLRPRPSRGYGSWRACCCVRYPSLS
jgi:glycosyltransferase involved in cell wall biosynthesis